MSTEEQIAEIRREALAAVDKFERDLGFTAPELWPMRIQQLRAGIEGAFTEKDDDDWFDDAAVSQ